VKVHPLGVRLNLDPVDGHWVIANDTGKWLAVCQDADTACRIEAALRGKLEVGDA
jgi:hypothetical protein